MKQQMLLPDIRRLLEPSGFYEAPPSRAYAAAGSFMRWLGDTHGGQKLLLRRGLQGWGAFWGNPLVQTATRDTKT
jgi:hypothetical protein